MINIIPKSNSLFDVITDTNNDAWQLKVNGNFSLSQYIGVGTIRDISIFSFNEISYGKIILKKSKECFKQEFIYPFFNEDTLPFNVTPKKIYVSTNNPATFSVDTKYGATLTYDINKFSVNPINILSGITNVSVSSLTNEASANNILVKENKTNLSEKIIVEESVPRRKFLNLYFLNDIPINNSIDLIIFKNSSLSFYVLSSNEITLSSDKDIKIISSNDSEKTVFNIKFYESTTTITVKNSDNLTFTLRVISF